MRVSWRPVLGWGLLAATLLVSLELIRLAPLWLGLGRELVGAAVAILAVAVGVGIARWWYAPGERLRADFGSSDRTQADARPVAAVGIAAMAATDGVGPQSGERATSPIGAVADGPAPVPALDALSPREREVLRLLADGLSNKELARALNVSENTIKTHLANLYAKLGTRNRVQALARAQALGVTAANRVEPGTTAVSDG